MKTPTELIDLLGGPTAVANLLGIKPPSVCEWKNKPEIPDDKLVRLAPYIERASCGSVSRRDLFPNDYSLIWPELATTLQPS